MSFAAICSAFCRRRKRTWKNYHKNILWIEKSERHLIAKRSPSNGLFCNIYGVCFIINGPQTGKNKSRHEQSLLYYKINFQKRVIRRGRHVSSLAKKRRRYVWLKVILWKKNKWYSWKSEGSLPFDYLICLPRHCVVRAEKNLQMEFVLQLLLVLMVSLLPIFCLWYFLLGRPHKGAECFQYDFIYSTHIHMQIQWLRFSK